MKNLLIGNLISAGASVFLAVSCVINDKRKACFCQLMESLLLVISSVFFLAWVRLITQALAVGRNYLVMEDKFTVRLMWIFTAAAAVIGLVVNTEGWLGLFPILGTVQLTLCNYYCKSLKATKWGFLVNVLIWGTYSFLIWDLAYGLANAGIAVAGAVSLWRLRKTEKTAED